MTLNFLTRRRTPVDCDHDSIIKSEISGLSRDLCADCGQVSVGYVREHYPTEAQEGAGSSTC